MSHRCSCKYEMLASEISVIGNNSSEVFWSLNDIYLQLIHSVNTFSNCGLLVKVECTVTHIQFRESLVVS